MKQYSLILLISQDILFFNNSCITNWIEVFHFNFRRIWTILLYINPHLFHDKPATKIS